jgi:hypothetical protein
MLLPVRRGAVKAALGLSISAAAVVAAPAKLFSIPAHDSGGRPEADADLAIDADKRAFGGNAPDNIFGGQRPPGWRILGHGVKAVPATAPPVKDTLARRYLAHGPDQVQDRPAAPRRDPEIHLRQ